MKKLLLVLALVVATPAHAIPSTLFDQFVLLLQRHTGKAPAAAKGTGAKTAFRTCPQFFAGGVSPRIPDGQRLALRALCYDAFAVLHSGVTKTPVIVAERLNKKQLDAARDEKRTNRFFADARLPMAERAQLEDYRGSGFDRGHMAPAANMPTAQAMAQSFSLANMVPQAPVNNQRAWAGIEKATRKYVMRAQGDVYVITGPVFEPHANVIGPNRVHVPSYLYKLVYDATTNRAWAHWIANTDQAHAGRPISYEALVRRTGIEFLSGIQPDH
ncbi:MAG TPA: DNA/RNA non-specific endonuclease [Burkholderiaceae bacterium]|nr:DNA/RNA non-specific endonuclease [Burkholderiaceae bacterium]